MYQAVVATYPNSKAAELSQSRIAQLQGAPPEGQRTWKNKNGKFSVTAALLAFDDANVRLRTSEGKETTVPMKSLSAEDLIFLKSQTAKKNSVPLGAK